MVYLLCPLFSCRASGFCEAATLLMRSRESGKRLSMKSRVTLKSPSEQELYGLKLNTRGKGLWTSASGVTQTRLQHRGWTLGQGRCQAVCRGWGQTICRVPREELPPEAHSKHADSAGLKQTLLCDWALSCNMMSSIPPGVAVLGGSWSLSFLRGICA